MIVANYAPGASAAAVAPQGVVVLGGDATPEQAAAVWRQLRSGAGVAGVIDVLAAGRALSSLPPFAIVIAEEAGWRVAVRGDVTLTVDDGTPLDLGSGSLWSERSIGDAASVSLSAGPADSAAPAPSGIPLADGVAVVSTIVLRRDDGVRPAVAPVVRAEVEPVQPHSLAEVHDDAPRATQPELPDEAASSASATGLTDSIPAHLRPHPEHPADPPVADAAPVSAVPGGSAAPPPPVAPPLPPSPPLPVPPAAVDDVEETVISPARRPAATPVGDHDGETISLAEARRLREAGELPHVAPAPAPAPTAVAGRVRVSSGQSVALDRAVVIGRRPRSTRTNGTDLPHLVSVASPQQDISRNHVEIRAEGDSILATDLNTTNGTTLRRAGSEPVRLHPGEPTMVVGGDVLDLGDGITVAIEAPA